VGILDGGWQRWTKGGGATSTEIPDVKPGDFDVVFQTDRLMTADTLQAQNRSGDAQIVDARSNREVAAGTVPGAIHLEWVDLKNADGTLKTPEELKRIFADKNLSPQKTAVTYCQSGGRASLNAFALELAGFEKVKNYYCGWQQWGDGKHPVKKPGKN
ncbi:MAG: sulfurtransferase, partial [Planctomycetaceae bacterium]